GLGIERAFAPFADQCRNIDRIGRLAGTINRKTGRRARVLHEHSHDERPPIEAFPRVDVEEMLAASGRADPRDIDLGIEAARSLVGPLTIDNLRRRGVPEMAIQLLMHGNFNKKHKSTSHTQLALAGYLLRAGLTPNETAGVLGSTHFVGCRHILN